MDDIIYGIKMEHKRGDNRKICFNCASIYEEKDEEILKCPICCKSISRNEYEKIMSCIRPIVFSSWTCRKQYENDKSGMRYYTEQCGEILNFVALAIASGILGNVAYDTVKAIIKKIASYLKLCAKTEEDKKFVDFLNSPDRIKEFSDYLSAYYDEFESVDDITKNAIREEIWVDQTSIIMDRLMKKHHEELDIDKIKNESPYEEKDVMRMVLEIRNELKIHKLEAEDFAHMWKDVE